MSSIDIILNTKQTIELFNNKFPKEHRVYR